MPAKRIFHAHYLSDKYLEEILPNIHESHYDNIQRGKQVVNRILSHNPQKIYLISIVRDPVSREISGIFENADSIRNIYNAELNITVIKKHINYILNSDRDWFNNEFMEFTGLDIYQLPFDKNKGYSIYDHSKYRI
ncbi:MAG: putative capsular polysaccharide synthesis family protein, partial [bacterium]